MTDWEANYQPGRVPISIGALVRLCVIPNNILVCSTTRLMRVKCAVLPQRISFMQPFPAPSHLFSQTI